MPDTPRTVRDRYEYTDPMEDGAEEAVCFYPNNPILDALIGCQGRVVYTEEDVERCEEAVRRNVLVATGGRVHLATKHCRGIVRAAITAAGGVVADEVVEVGELRKDCPVPSDGEPLRMCSDGDKLYIVRAKEE